jgi:tRNA (cytidine/uridine-2'-O-)-methyltransferase
MDVALHEPDIPQNTAAILRTAACLCARVHIVGPAAFDLSDRAARRAGLDYAARATVLRHADFESFREAITHRVVLFTTRARNLVTDFKFAPDDVLLFGSESRGVPEAVHAACLHAVRIPMAPDARSLNLAVSVGVGLFAALASSGAIATKGLS